MFRIRKQKVCRAQKSGLKGSMQTMYGGLERSKELQTKEIPANRKMLKKHTKDNRTRIKHNSSRKTHKTQKCYW